MIFFHFKFIELVNAYYKKYPLDNVNNMEKYYKLYSAETGKQALRGGLETQFFHMVKKSFFSQEFKICLFLHQLQKKVIIFTISPV